MESMASRGSMLIFRASSQLRRQISYPHNLNGSYSHVTSLSEEMGSILRKIFAGTFRRYLGLQGMATMLQLPLMLEGREVVFSGESHIKLHDCSLCVWHHHGERMLPICTWHHHTSSSSGVKVRGAIGYTSRSHLVRNDGIFNCSQYIFVAVNMWLSFLLELSKLQDCILPVDYMIFDAENVWLHHWPAHSPDPLNLPADFVRFND